MLLPALREQLAGEAPAPPAEEEEAGETQDAEARPPAGPLLEGWEHLGRVVAVDQSLLGRTPRSNPAVYIGAFDEIRELFARTPPPNSAA